MSRKRWSWGPLWPPMRRRHRTTTTGTRLRKIQVWKCGSLQWWRTFWSESETGVSEASRRRSSDPRTTSRWGTGNRKRPRDWEGRPRLETRGSGTIWVRKERSQNSFLVGNLHSDLRLESKVRRTNTHSLWVGSWLVGPDGEYTSEPDPSHKPIGCHVPHTNHPKRDVETEIRFESNEG